MSTSTLVKSLSMAAAGTAAFIALGSTGAAQALTINYSGAGFGIPDNNAGGISSDIVVSDNLNGSYPCSKIKTVSPCDFQPFFSRPPWVQSMKP